MPQIDFDATVDLTAEEWMSLIDGSREGDPQSLQKCCANISDLRDQIIALARDGGRYQTNSRFVLRSYLACVNGHDMTGIPALQKIIAACLAHQGMTMEELLALNHADRNYIEG